MTRRRGPAAMSVLAMAGTVLGGCAGIIPDFIKGTPATARVSETAPQTLAQPEAAPSPGAAPAAAAPARAAASPAADQAAPLPSNAGEATGFARFVSYALAAARDAGAGAELASALLADPVALDGKRRRCAVGEQLVAVIDLDPAGGAFAPPASPVASPGAVSGLALLREAGLEIAWISDLPTERSGAVRTALEQSGLDPRGQDILSLRRDEADTKDQRKASLGGFACIVAIAGDERPDFDMRFKYLRNPRDGVAIEGVLGDGWFLVEPPFADGEPSAP